MIQTGKDALAKVLETSADMADDATDVGAAVVDASSETITETVAHASDLATGFVKIPARFARHIAAALRDPDPSG